MSVVHKSCINIPFKENYNEGIYISTKVIFMKIHLYSLNISINLLLSSHSSTPIKCLLSFNDQLPLNKMGTCIRRRASGVGHTYTRIYIYIYTKKHNNCNCVLLNCPDSTSSNTVAIELREICVI